MSKVNLMKHTCIFHHCGNRLRESNELRENVDPIIEAMAESYWLNESQHIVLYEITENMSTVERKNL
jgi:hypothetical protein